MTDPVAFWVDADDDRDRADDGVSRYGAYVRMGTFEPITDDGQAVELAVYAWGRATGPVMTPGYVRRHNRILSAQLERSDWDGSLLAAVDVLTPAPAGLRGSVLPGGALWWDWPTEWAYAGDHYTYYEPGSEDVAQHPHMLTSVSLRFAVPGDLPEPLPGGVDAETCIRSVAVVVARLNVIVGPVLARIEGS